jgi:hypothetical protein
LRRLVLPTNLTEALDRMLDKALAVLFDGLDHADARQRIRAASAVLRIVPARRATRRRA